MAGLNWRFGDSKTSEIGSLFSRSSQFSAETEKLSSTGASRNPRTRVTNYVGHMKKLWPMSGEKKDFMVKADLQLRLKVPARHRVLGRDMLEELAVCTETRRCDASSHFRGNGSEAAD